MNAEHAHIAASIPHHVPVNTLALSVLSLLALSAVLEDLILAETAHGVTLDVIEQMDSVKKASAAFESARDALPHTTPRRTN